MKSDKSRETFRPDKRYSSVRLQQGRVLTDADWNEQSDIIEYRNEVTTQDVIGQSGVPVPPNGFDVAASTTDPNDFTISQGRIYVDGILAENNLGTTYLTQPFPFFDVGAASGNFDPMNPPPPPAPQSSGVVVAYVDVWQRHIDVIDDPTIREVALGGPDTATRAQTVWQVKFLDIHSTETVPTEPDSLPEFQELVNPSVPPAMLSAQVEVPPVSTNPCIIPQSAGFRLLENQLYRVEVHTGGSLSPDPSSPVFINQGDSTGSLEVTFKWSRDNGSVTVAWLPNPPQAAANTLTVQLLTTDETKGFSIGDWVELTDDSRDLAGVAGTFVQLTNVLGNTLTFNPDSAHIQDPINGNVTPVRGLDANHPRVRRWDMTTPPLAVSRDESDANKGFVNLEAGVQVLFGAGTYKPGDYWEIPARTLSGDVEWPIEADGVTPQPLLPFGIKHHYACLTAFHEPNFTNKQDCRKLFKPLTEVNPPTPNDDPVSGQFRYYLVDNVDGNDSTGKPGIDNASATALGMAIPFPFQTLGAVATIFPRDGHDSTAIVLIRATTVPYAETFSMSGVHGYRKVIIRGSSFENINVDPEPRISGGQPISTFPNGLVVSALSVRNRITFNDVLDGAADSHVGQRVRFDPNTTNAQLRQTCSMVLGNDVTDNASGSAVGSFIDLGDDLGADNVNAVSGDLLFLEDPGVFLNGIELSIDARTNQEDDAGLAIVGLNLGELRLLGPGDVEIAFCKAGDASAFGFGIVSCNGQFVDENGAGWNLGLGVNTPDAFFNEGFDLEFANSAMAFCEIGTVNVANFSHGIFTSLVTITDCDFSMGQGRNGDSSAPFLIRLGVGGLAPGIEVTDCDGTVSGAKIENLFDPSSPTVAAIRFDGVGRSLSMSDIVAPKLTSNNVSGIILDASGAIASRFVYDPLTPVSTVVSGIFQLPGASFFRPFELSQTDVIDSADNHYLAPPRSFIQKGLALQGIEQITRYQVAQYVTASATNPALTGQVQKAQCKLTTFIANADALAATIAGIAQQEILPGATGSSFSMHVTTGYTLVSYDLSASAPSTFPAPVYLSDANAGTVTATPPTNNPVVRIGVMVRLIDYGDNAHYSRLAFVRLQLDQALNPPASTPTPPPAPPPPPVGGA